MKPQKYRSNVAFFILIILICNILSYKNYSLLIIKLFVYSKSRSQLEIIFGRKYVKHPRKEVHDLPFDISRASAKHTRRVCKSTLLRHLIVNIYKS